MNKEMKLLVKKLTALFLSLALVVGLVPATVQAQTTNEFSFEILDYVGTYYEGFNDNVAVASGTFIDLSCDGESNFIQVNDAIAKDDNEGYIEEITINGNDLATAQIVYESDSVYIKVIYDGEEIYSEVLYTPNYLDISQMPAISLGQEVTVADGTAKYCEQYYRIDESSVSALNKYKVFTLAVEDEDDESDTYIYLYDESGILLDENDDSEGYEDDVDSSLTFEMPESGARVVGVRGYEYAPLTTATLKLVGGATKVVTFESDNIDSLNVFYEGFNDDLLYATGTRIQATLDNNVVSEWQSVGCYWDDEDDEDDEDDVDILFGDVKASLYRGDDGAVYADYGLNYEDALTTKKLFTPVIKPVTDIPQITEGESIINTLEWSGAYSYYRITAEEDEVWDLNFACTGDPYDYWELYVDAYQSDGTMLYSEEQPYNEDTEEVEDFSVEVSVEAGSTIIIGLYDDSEESQEYTLTATKQSDEDETTTPEESSDDSGETTTPEESSSDDNGETTTPDEQPSSDNNETTTPEPTTPTICPTPPADTIETTTAENKTTVAPTTTAKKKVTPPKRTKVKKATKKKAAKKVKLSIKKIKGARGYKVQFSKKKKFTKKNILVTKIVKKAKVTIKNKKLKKAKKLFVRVKAYKLNGKKKVWAKKWSKVKKVSIKK